MMAAPVAAQAPVAAAPAITPGMEVRGPAEALVGTVKSVDDTYVIVTTDRHEARLPKASFTPHEGKLLFGLTRDQLNAEVDKMEAAAQAALVPGAEVKGAAGATVGSIDAIDAEFVTLKLQSGKLVRLPRTSIGVGADGPMISLTVAELEAVAA